ncbi:prepilin peptidase [Pararhodospirillum photometricum]|nr:prepilin peptidase [Pararhodospirillum photometricum]
MVGLGLGLGAGAAGATLGFPGGLAGVGLVSVILAVALIDLDHAVVHDSLALALVLQAVAWRWSLEGLTPDPLVRGLLVFLAAQAMRWLYRRVRGREGLGGGDPAVIAAAALAVSWDSLPLLLSGTGGLALGHIALRAAVSRVRGESGPVTCPLAPSLLATLSVLLSLELITRGHMLSFRVFFGA